MHVASPNAAHHALLTDLHAIMARYQSMPVIERIAILAQTVGALVAEAPPEFSSGELLQAIAFNLASGNQGAGGGLAIGGTVGHG